MVLDVYVMPLWRYLAREDEWERGTFAADPANRALSVSPAEARSFVARLRYGFRDVSRNAMRWHDKGATVFARPFDLASWNALRAFAADQQYPVPGFNFTVFLTDASPPGGSADALSTLGGLALSVAKTVLTDRL